MSTPCRIIVKINKEDIGKIKKFDLCKLPIPYGEWINRDPNGKICRNEVAETPIYENVTLNGEYIGVYCHWDGDTNSTGRILKNNFNTYEQVLNLVLGGAISGIASGQLHHYANRQDETHGETWEDIEPIQGTLDHIRENIYGQYEHIFENGKWKSKRCV